MAVLPDALFLFSAFLVGTMAVGVWANIGRVLVLYFAGTFDFFGGASAFV